MADDHRLLGPLERLLFLRSMEVLIALPPEESAKLALVATDRFFPSGTVICEDGAQIDSVFLIVDGVARISWDDSVVDVRTGDGLNWLRLLSGRNTSRRAAAIENVAALEIRATDLLDLYEESPEFLEGTIREYIRVVLGIRGPLPTTDRSQIPDVGPVPTEPLGLVGRIGVIVEAGAVWEDASMDTLVTIARNLVEVRIGKGDYLWRLGDPAHSPHWLRHGNVRCVDAEGNRVDIASPYGLGFFDALVGETRRHDAVALTDVVALRWDVGTLFGVLEHTPLLALRMLGRIAETLADLFDRQSSLAVESNTKSA